MRFFPMNNRILRLIFQFFFPLSSEVRRLEEMSAADYIHALPGAESPRGNIFVLWKYADPLVKTAVWEIKYRKNIRIAERVGEILYAQILGELEDSLIFGKKKRIVLLPIPSSRKKHFEKGYNQTELICEMIKKHDTENIFEYRNDVLLRIKEVLPQTKTGTKKERESNPKNSFGINDKKDTEGKTVVLIDDVVTTGSTLKEAIKVLKENGVKEIRAFVIAH